MARVTPTLSVEQVLGTKCRIDVHLPEVIRLFLVVLVTFRGAVIHSPIIDSLIIDSLSASKQFRLACGCIGGGALFLPMFAQSA